MNFLPYCGHISAIDRVVDDWKLAFRFKPAANATEGKSGCECLPNSDSFEKINFPIDSRLLVST